MVAKTETPKKATAKKASPKAETVDNGFADAFSIAKEQWEKVLGSNDVVTEFHKENFEALSKSAALANESFEKIAKESVAYQQKAVEDGLAIASEAMSASSVQEAMEIQSNFVKAFFEAYVGHMTKLGEMWSAGAQSAAKPLNERAGAVFQSAQKIRA